MSEHSDIPPTVFAPARVCSSCLGVEQSCINCGTRFRLTTAVIALRVGGETIGYVCEGCLAPDARACLAAWVRGGKP